MTFIWSFLLVALSSTTSNSIVQCVKPDAKVSQGSFPKDDLINEYYDTNMGVAFSMVTRMSWEWGGHWGLAPDPNSVPDGKIRYVSIMTHKQDMAPFGDYAYGLIFHITPESNFWKHFMAIKSGGKGAGGIVGGPGDGGSHTPSQQMVLPESMGKNYEWFASEKKKILDKYNTVYKHHDYNEFIAKGTSKLALAGIFHNTRSRRFTPSDEQMCDTLRHVRGGKWPIYAYDWQRKSLSIERYVTCDDRKDDDIKGIGEPAAKESQRTLSNHDEISDDHDDHVTKDIGEPDQCVNCGHSTSSDADLLTYLASIRKISIPPEGIQNIVAEPGTLGATYYTIVLTLAGDESVVQASRRFREFNKLRQKLTLVPSDGKFPGKQFVPDLVCALAKSLQSCVEDRRLGLEAYLNRAKNHITQTDDEATAFQARILATFLFKGDDTSSDQMPFRIGGKVFSLSELHLP